MTQFHQTPVFPRGFTCASRNCGLKPEGKDLSLFASTVDAAAAAVFTRNHFPGAPVLLGRETIRAGALRGVIVNSKVSNVATGGRGLEDARAMAAAAAAELGTEPGRVLVSSTGVIGVPLPIEKILRGIQGMGADLQDDPVVGALGIMTTDTQPKALSLSVGNATLTLIAKGSGMIAPNMATLLCYMFTDAALPAAQLQDLLADAVRDSFNMLSVDTDASTSDTCAILANGLAGDVDAVGFPAALRAASIRMTEILARDGEGATKLLRVHVRGAGAVDQARRLARSVVDSPLVKTMTYGADPNVGRLLMAVGKCFDCAVDPAATCAWINGVMVVKNGTRASFDEAGLRASLAGDPVDVEIDVGVADASATAYGCDLTEGYIRENAAYYSS